jgi:hypothetical protein
MPRSLPENASLEALKKQAKALLKSRKQQAPDKPAGLQECQHALAQDYGCRDWAELKKTVLGKAGDARGLPENGDSGRGPVRSPAAEPKMAPTIVRASHPH